MLVPSLFTDRFMNDFFNDAFDYTPNLFYSTGSTQMSADVRECKDHYELTLELPGYAKEDVTASLKDGYLTIDAERTSDKKEGEEDDSRYIRRERFSGKIQRTFYVGEAVKQEDIQAKFENGVLEITVPKVTPQPEVEEAKTIAIA